eukprot:TRINITY_DN863_c0_g1_i1.p1 TRINITY_DN863_c0_g1~~TRINITY_DN863_c0_g1_i1.p1  ORF type:complete len:369 (+),score=162.47 TRINITY_DN863_c0_g1_i1:38-1108(+)
MGNACITNPNQQLAKKEVDASKTIEIALRRDKRKLESEIKILLLGTGESGKSTFFKQMEILHKEGFSSEVRAGYSEIINSNIILSMRTFIISLNKNDQFQRLLAPYQDDVETFLSPAILFEQSLSPELSKSIYKIWSDQEIKKAYEALNSQQSDSASYFFNDVTRISKPDYIPTDQDILRARSRTTGAAEIQFASQQVNFRMVDVGGQRSERRKWMHCFEGVTSLLYFASIGEYDLALYEDSSVNRLAESLMLFRELINCDWFKDSPIVLFLNKSDIFAEKIKRVDLNVAFPDYKDGKDEKAGLSYIKEQFLKCNQNSSRNIYTHVTVATNTDNITRVFMAIKDLMLRTAFNQIGD